MLVRCLPEGFPLFYFGRLLNPYSYFFGIEDEFKVRGNVVSFDGTLVCLFDVVVNSDRGGSLKKAREFGGEFDLRRLEIRIGRADFLCKFLNFLEVAVVRKRVF